MAITDRENAATLVEIQSRLEALAAALASGKSSDVEQQAARLDGAIQLLRKLRETFSVNTAPEEAAYLLAALRRIRAQCATLREAAARGEDTARALAGILALLYNAGAGAQYSAYGLPSLPPASRLRAEA